MATSFEHVRPGDLISADLVNTIMDQVNSLNARVTSLESKVAAGGAVHIMSVISTKGPTAPIRVGDNVQILGANFRYTLGQQRALFDGKETPRYLPISTDSFLIVEVPNLPDLPENGKTVVLTVENGTSSDTADIRVLPVEVILNGDINLLWQDIADNPVPNPIVADTQNALFGLSLRSDANLIAKYLIDPKIVLKSNPQDAEPFGELILLDSRRVEVLDNQIEVRPNETVNLFIRAARVPVGTTGAFRLNVTARAGSLSSDLSKIFEIDRAVAQADPDIVLDPPRFSGETSSGANDPSAAFDGSSLRLRAESIGVFSYQVTFKSRATYEYFADFSSDTSGWQVNPPAMAPQRLPDQPAGTENIELRVSPTASASSSGTLNFHVRKQGATTEQLRQYDLIRL